MQGPIGRWGARQGAEAMETFITRVVAPLARELAPEIASRLRQGGKIALDTAQFVAHEGIKKGQETAVFVGRKSKEMKDTSQMMARTIGSNMQEFAQEGINQTTEALNTEAGQRVKKEAINFSKGMFQSEMASLIGIDNTDTNKSMAGYNSFTGGGKGLALELVSALFGYKLGELKKQYGIQGLEINKHANKAFMNLGQKTHLQLSTANATMQTIQPKQFAEMAVAAVILTMAQAKSMDVRPKSLTNYQKTQKGSGFFQQSNNSEPEFKPKTPRPSSEK